MVTGCCVTQGNVRKICSCLTHDPALQTIFGRNFDRIADNFVQTVILLQYFVDYAPSVISIVSLTHREFQNFWV